MESMRWRGSAVGQWRLGGTPLLELRCWTIAEECSQVGQEVERGRSGRSAGRGRRSLQQLKACSC